VAEPSPHVRFVGAAGFAAVAFVQVRISLSDVQRYGDDGAPWIEHLERLRVLQALRSPGAGWFERLDGAYPPPLHLASAALWPVGAGLGDVAVTRTSVLWLLLLATAVAAVAHRWKPEAAPWAFAFACFLPAAQGAASRYYYDLPMTAMLWAAVAAGVVGLTRSGPRAGAAYGALWAVACLVKWTALPLGGLMLVALLLDPRELGLRRRVEAVVVAVLVAAGAVLLWRALAGEGSFAATAGATFGGDRSSVDLAARLDDLLHFTRMHGTFGRDRLAFYPAALVTHVLSPLGFAALAAPLGLWLVRGVGRPALLLLVALPIGFFVALVPVVDQRFALTLGPALLLAAAIGVTALPRRGEVVVGAVLLGALVLASAEHHFGVPPLPRERIEIVRLNQLDHTTSYAEGIALADSFEDRGWGQRGDERPSHRDARDTIVGFLDACAPAHVAVADLGPNAPPVEDRIWLDYLTLRATLLGRPFHLTRGCSNADGADLVLGANLEERPPCVPPDWVDAATLELPDTFDYDGHVWLPPDARCAP